MNIFRDVLEKQKQKQLKHVYEYIRRDVWRNRKQMTPSMTLNDTETIRWQKAYISFAWSYRFLASMAFWFNI